MGFTVEPELILEAQSDSGALDRLLIALWPEAFRMAFGVLHDHGMAEDAAQEACASIALGLPTLRSTAAFYGWMYRIILRHATVAAKRRRRAHDLESQNIPQDASNDTDRVDLLNAIANLPLSQRTAILLHYYAGFNSGEIAGILSVPAPTIRFHLMRARRALRAALTVTDTGNSPLEAYRHVQ